MPIAPATYDVKVTEKTPTKEYDPQSYEGQKRRQKGHKNVLKPQRQQAHVASAG